MKDLRIVFMGTPDFAVGVLKELVDTNHAIVGVVTAPDKPAGRGQQISKSAVKIYAEETGLSILQPVKLKEETFLEELRALKADLFIVVAFRMLPEIVWAMPPKGTINLHGSLLPQYRGAAPINWAIVNGEKKTGVTTFFIEKEIDTGMILAKEEVDITENQTAGELHDELLEIGKKLIVRSVKMIVENDFTKIPQETLVEGELKNAPKIFKEDCKINWKQPIEAIHNFIRGFSPYPTAWTVLDFGEKKQQKTLKIFKTLKTTIPVPEELKDVVVMTKNEIRIPCADFYIEIHELQLEGKKKMTAKEFVVGYNSEKIKVAQ